jgi:hypothetical protein
MTPLETAGTAECRTRNLEGRRRRWPRKGAKRHEKLADSQPFSWLSGASLYAWPPTENEQINIEQGMSKEEGRELSEQIATKRRANTKVRSWRTRETGIGEMRKALFQSCLLMKK